MSPLDQLSKRVDELAATVRAFGPVVGTVAMHDAEIEALQQDVRDMRRGRRDVTIALIALIGTLGSALIAGGVALVIHFAGAG